MEELSSIVFVSSAVKDLAPEQIRQVTDEAGQVNKKKGITGLTIFAHGNVLVILEGPSEAVNKRFDELIKHPSHHSIIKILSTRINQRSFEDFPLALKIYGTPEYKGVCDFVSPEMKEYFEEFLQMGTPVSNAVLNYIRSNT